MASKIILTTIPGNASDGPSKGIQTFQLGAAKNARSEAIIKSTDLVASLSVAPPNITSITAASTTINYKLRGWNSTTKQFEVWTSTNPYSSPPSNNSLIDVTYAEFET